MTEPLSSNERDELASAYVDGELNQDGIALVESDPKLLALVAEHRAVQSKVGSPTSSPPASVKAQHLASALAAFDELAASPKEAEPPQHDVIVLGGDNSLGSPTDNTVISLTERSAVRESRRSRSGMPSWLSAAAASVAVLGGISFAATQFNGGSSDADAGSSASAEFDKGESTSQSMAAVDDAMADDLDGAMDDGSPEAAASMIESPADSSSSDDDGTENSTGSQPATEGEDPANPDVADDDEGGDGTLRIHEPAIEFPSDYSAAEVLGIVGIDGFPIEESVCAFNYELPAEMDKADLPSEPDRFLPVLLGGQPVELFVYGPETAVLIDIDTCSPIPDGSSE